MINTMIMFLPLKHLSGRDLLLNGYSIWIKPNMSKSIKIHSRLWDSVETDRSTVDWKTVSETDWPELARPISKLTSELLISTPSGLFLAYFHANLNFCGDLGWIGDNLECICCVLRRFVAFCSDLATTLSAFAAFCGVLRETVLRQIDQN
jgi:hypothetical protein